MRNSLLIAKLVTLILMAISGLAYATPEGKPIVGWISNLDEESSKCVKIFRGKENQISANEVIPGMPLQVDDVVEFTCDSGSITVQEGGKPYTTKGKEKHRISGKTALEDEQVGILMAAWGVLKRAGYLVVAVTTTGIRTGCSDNSKVRWEGENSQQIIAAGRRPLHIGLNRECYPQPPSKVELCPSVGECQNITSPQIADWTKDKQLLGDVVIPAANFEDGKSYTVNMSWNNITSTVVKFKTIADGDKQLSLLSSKVDGNSSLPIFVALSSWDNDSNHALEAYQKVAGQSGYLAKVAKTVISMKKTPKIQH